MKINEIWKLYSWKSGVYLIHPPKLCASLLVAKARGAKVSNHSDHRNEPRKSARVEVMIGFCNGLAIVIGNAQIHPFRDHHHNWVRRVGAARFRWAEFHMFTKFMNNSMFVAFHLRWWQLGREVTGSELGGMIAITRTSMDSRVGSSGVVAGVSNAVCMQNRACTSCDES